MIGIDVMTGKKPRNRMMKKMKGHMIPGTSGATLVRGGGGGVSHIF